MHEQPASVQNPRYILAARVPCARTRSLAPASACHARAARLPVSAFLPAHSASLAVHANANAVNIAYARSARAGLRARQGRNAGNVYSP